MKIKAFFFFSGNGALQIPDRRQTTAYRRQTTADGRPPTADGRPCYRINLAVSSQRSTVCRLRSAVCSSGLRAFRSLKQCRQIQRGRFALAGQRDIFARQRIFAHAVCSADQANRLRQFRRWHFGNHILPDRFF